jgi:fatty acid desaturase
MASKRKPEGVELVLLLILASVLTLVSVVPFLAFLELVPPSNELVIAIIVFAAWLLVLTLVAPVFQKRWHGQESEQVR